MLTPELYSYKLGRQTRWNTNNLASVTLKSSIPVLWNRSEGPLSGGMVGCPKFVTAALGNIYNMDETVYALTRPVILSRED